MDSFMSYFDTPFTCSYPALIVPSYLAFWRWFIGTEITEFAFLRK